MKISHALILSLITSMSALPAQAESTTCHAVLEVHSPDKEHIWVPGKLQHADGQFTLTYTRVNKDAKALPPETTVTLDEIKESAMRVSGGIHKDLDFGALSKAKFSAIASDPELLGGFALIGDRLKTDAKFIRNGTYGNEPIQEYTFQESDTVFGQILYSPAYGVPLRLEVIDSKAGTRHIIELKGIAR